MLRGYQLPSSSLLRCRPRAHPPTPDLQMVATFDGRSWKRNRGNRLPEDQSSGRLLLATPRGRSVHGRASWARLHGERIVATLEVAEQLIDQRPRRPKNRRP